MRKHVTDALSPRHAQPLGYRLCRLSQCSPGLAVERVVEKSGRTERSDDADEFSLMIEKWRRESENTWQHFAGCVAHAVLPDFLQPSPKLLAAGDRHFSLFQFRELLFDAR